MQMLVLTAPNIFTAKFHVTKQSADAPNPKKQNVQQIGHVCEPAQIQFEVKQKQRRYHKQDAIKEHSPGCQNRIVAKAADLPCENRIARP